jgi:P4 family phage/plasmid primase-like protien
MVDRLQEHGGDPKHTDSLIDGVRTLGGNQLQTATLLALLQRELKDAGLLTKPIRQQLDQAAGGVAISRAAGQYGKNHTENATLYVERYHPGGTLLRADQVWYAYDGRAWVEYSDDDLKCGVSLDMAPSLPQLSAISGTYGVLAHMCHARGRAIGDVDPALVLFQNGVLDLRTGSLLPHSPEYFTTNILPYDFNPTARCDQWLRFLAEVFEGDQERIELLQEWFGYMMSASYAYHKIMLLLGPPRCGKGTIGRMLAQLVGEQNFTGGSLHAFTSDSFLESLMTKTVVFSGDTAKRLAPATVDIVIEQVKKISGGDAIAFNRKWKSTISRTLPARITLASNHVPSLFDDSGALSGRLMALPFEVSFAGREDPGLFDRLLPDIEGVAAWALQGLARLNSVGRFTVPVASEVEAQFIRETYSPLQVFIADVCTIGEGKTGGDDLYDAYRAWAVTHQEDRILARRTFIGAFKDATRGTGCRYGPQRIDGHIVRGFSGLTVGKVDSMTAAAFAPQLVGK